MRLLSRASSPRFNWAASKVRSLLRKKMSSKTHLDASEVYCSAIRAVSPPSLVSKALHFDPHTDVLSVEGVEYLLHKNVKLVAFGKAVFGMVTAAMDILGEHITDGVASVPVGTIDISRKSSPHYPSILENSKIKLYEGAADNLPDTAAESAARHILSVVRSASEGDLVMVFISGGGSALLPCPVEGVSLHEKRMIVESLARNGATINDLNIVRKSISMVKGGKLAEAAFPAKVIALVLSDVINDPLDIIASGPTVPNMATTKDSLQILEKYHLLETTPSSILDHLNSSQDGCSKEGVVPILNGQYSHVQNMIVGNNKIATAAASASASALGYDCCVWSHRIQGEARLLGQVYARLAWTLLKFKKDFDGTQGDVKECLLSQLQKDDFVELFKSVPALKEDLLNLSEKLMISHKPICLISAGEPTVTVKGTGRGGRNQELVLSFAIELDNLSLLQSADLRHSSRQDTLISQCVFLSVGTDGQDGPCDAAGAITNTTIITAAQKQGLDAARFLENNDSYTFFSSLDTGEYLIRTGLTGTNVMDLQILFL